MDPYLWLSTERDEYKEPTGRVVVWDNAGDRCDLDTFTGAARQRMANALLSTRNCTQNANAIIQRVLKETKNTERLEAWSQYYSRLEDAKGRFEALEKTDLATVSVDFTHQLLSELPESQKAHELLFTDKVDLEFDDLYRLCGPVCICDHPWIEPAESQTESTGTEE